MSKAFRVTAVSNASPLHYLILLGYADVLPTLFERVLVPAAVVRELQHSDTPLPVREWFEFQRVWMSVHHEPVPTLSSLPRHLHAGEVQAIQLARHRQISLVLLDDFEARRAAERQGLKAVGTLRLLAEASLTGLLRYLKHLSD